MLQYTVKRLLLIPPTFFLISLVIFLVLNIAPGRPGEQMQAGQGESRSSQTQKESYRIFKEQFNLDKPILVNIRTTIRQKRVRELLAISWNVDSEHKAKERIQAQDKLEDLGNYLVRHLIVLTQEDSNPQIQRLAAEQLTQAAQQRYVPERGRNPSVAREANRQIRQANDRIKEFYWTDEDDDTHVEQIKQSWQTWWQENQEEYTFSVGESLVIFFFDTRFAKYWGNLVRFDFGVSTVDRRPVLPTVLSKIRYSLSLTLVSALLAYLIAVPIGIYSAVNQNTKSDMVITVTLFIFFSLPTFFTGTVFLRLLSEGDPVAWFPTGGYQSMNARDLTTLGRLGDIGWHLVLPLITYTVGSLAALSRYARSGIIDVIRADYVRTARAKGLPEALVIIKHAARNGMIPILTLLGTLLPVLVSGSVVIEVVFGIPGMGLFLYDSINQRDYNAVMAILIMASILTMVGILISDILIAMADPRISFE